MMRESVSWLLVFILVVQVGPVVAYNSETDPGDLVITLEARLSDMSAEAARFLDGKPEAERRWAHNDVYIAHIRQQLEQVSVNALVVANLTTEETVSGRLKAVRDDVFVLVKTEPMGASSPVAEVRFEDVETVTFAQEPSSNSKDGGITTFGWVLIIVGGSFLGLLLFCSLAAEHTCAIQ